MSDWTPEFVAAYKRLEAELASERAKVRELEEKLHNATANTEKDEPRTHDL